MKPSFLPTAEQIRKLRGNLTPNDPKRAERKWCLDHVDSLLAERFPGYMEKLVFKAHRVGRKNNNWGAAVLRVGDMIVHGGRIFTMDNIVSQEARRVLGMLDYIQDQNIEVEKTTREPDMGFMGESWAKDLVARLDGELAVLQAQSLDAQTTAVSKVAQRIRI